MYLHAADLGNVHPCIQDWDLQLDGFFDSILAFIAAISMFRFPVFTLDGIGDDRFCYVELLNDGYLFSNNSL